MQSSPRNSSYGNWRPGSRLTTLKPTAHGMWRREALSSPHTITVVGVSWLDNGLAISKYFENQLLLVSHIFEFENCTRSRHRVDGRHEAVHFTIALVVVECLLGIEVAETIVAKPLSICVFVHIVEERWKIFDPGKVLVPVEEVDVRWELLFRQINWESLEAIVGEAVN